MKVFFNSGEIIVGPRSSVMRAIKRRKKDDPHLKYKFSGLFTELEEALYDLRSDNLNWFRDNYSGEIIEEAIRIEAWRRHSLFPLYPAHMYRGGSK